MTLAEMHKEFERKLRNMDIILDTPTSEISDIFYEAEYVFIDKYYDTFEENEKSRKALSLLTVETDITPDDTSPILPNSYKAAIPEETLYVVFEIATLDGIPVKVKPISLDGYNTNLNNPFKKPYTKLVWRVEMIPIGTTSKLHILVSPLGGIISNYQIGYIKIPTKYTIETNPSDEMEVPEIFQYEIIDMAIQMFLNSHQILNNRNENKNKS